MRNGYKNEKLVLVFGFLATVCCCCCCCCSTSKVKIYAAPAWTERLVRDFVATFQFKATTTTTTATITTKATSICNWNFIWCFRFSTIFVDSKAFALCFRIVSVVVHTSFELSCACACVCASSLYALISIMIARLFSQILSFVFIRTRISLLSIFLYLSLSHSVCACVCVWLMALGFFKECSQSVATWLLSARTPASPTLPLYLPLVRQDVQMRLPKIFSLMELSGFLWLLLLQIYVQHTHTMHECVCVCICFEVNLWKCWTKNFIFFFLFLLLIKWKEDAHCGAGLGAPWKSRDKAWSPFCIIVIYDDLY